MVLHHTRSMFEEQGLSSAAELGLSAALLPLAEPVEPGLINVELAPVTEADLTNLY
jgi:hypothetical protein